MTAVNQTYGAHEHGWDCFETSGGMTNAMEVHVPLAERVESVYKTAYRTGFRNGQHRFEEVRNAAQAVADRFTQSDLLTASAVARLRHALAEYERTRGMLVLPGAHTRDNEV